MRYCKVQPGKLYTVKAPCYGFLFSLQGNKQNIEKGTVVMYLRDEHEHPYLSYDSNGHHMVLCLVNDAILAMWSGHLTEVISQ